MLISLRSSDHSARIAHREVALPPDASLVGLAGACSKITN